MRPLTFILLFTGSIFTATAQEQPTREIIAEAGTKYHPLVETYSVLISDKQTRQGLYELREKNGLRALLVRGYYKNGKKDSLWESYYTEKILLARKWYADGKGTGIWELNGPGGQPNVRYDFSTGKITWLGRQPADTTTYLYANANGEWVRGPLDSPPMLLISSSEWLSLLNINLRYPDEAVDKKQKGKVYICITIDEQGNASSYGIFKSSGYELLDREALRVVKLYDGEFATAQLQGKKVKSMLVQPIVFQLEVFR